MPCCQARARTGNRRATSGWAVGPAGGRSPLCAVRHAVRRGTAGAARDGAALAGRTPQGAPDEGPRRHGGQRPAMPLGYYSWRYHALLRARERDITREYVIEVLTEG